MHPISATSCALWVGEAYCWSCYCKASFSRDSLDTILWFNEPFNLVQRQNLHRNWNSDLQTKGSESGTKKDWEKFAINGNAAKSALKIPPGQKPIRLFYWFSSHALSALTKLVGIGVAVVASSGRPMVELQHSNLHNFRFSCESNHLILKDPWRALCLCNGNYHGRKQRNFSLIIVWWQMTLERFYLNRARASKQETFMQ